MLNMFNKMDKTMKIVCLILAIVIVISSVALVGVLVSRGNNSGNPIDPNLDDGKVTVKWCQGQKVLREDEIETGSKVSSWTPTVQGKEFIGWFANPGLTTAFDFTVAITEDIIIYASFKTTGAVDSVDPVTPDYYLAGTGRGSLATISAWSPTDMGLGMKDDGDGKYSITVDLYAGDVFQILHGGSWDGQMGVTSFEGVLTNEDTGVHEVFDSNGSVVFYGSGMNGIDITLAEGKDGQYIIRLDSVEGVITFEFVKALDPNDIPEIPVGDATYTVAGNAGLCGSEWSCDDANNDMTLDEATGLYIITYTGIPAGSYQFKICENHAWGVSYGDPNNAADSNNVNITVAEDNAIVIISFNPETHEITVIDGNGNNIGGAVTDTPVTGDAAIYFVGSMNNWADGANDDKWLLTNTDGVWTGTLTVTEETQVKLYDKSGLYGEYGGWIAPSAGTGENGNAVLSAGTYHFKYVEGDANFTYWADGESEPSTPTTPSTPSASTTYTVVGESGLCGSEWDIADTDNDMTYNSTTGLYTKVYSSVAAGTYQYKVVMNHAWGDGEYPTDGVNKTVTVTEGGATVTVAWNPTTSTLNAVVTDASGNPIVPDPSTTTYTVAGNEGLCGSEWNNADSVNDMTLSGGVYTITYTGIAIGQYEFKIVVNHSWDECYGDSLNPSDGNFKIDVTSANTTVVITFNPETKAITAKDASGTDLSVDFSTPVVPGGETTKVYVQNSADWGTVYCYCWNASNVGYKSWPGEEMTYDATLDLWYYEIPEGYVNVIFNNGSGTQTSDLSTPTTNAVAYNNATIQWYTLENLPQGDVQVTDIWGVVGSFTNWGNDVLMTEVEPGVWEATVELSAGDEFKVRKNYAWSAEFGQDGVHGGSNIVVSEAGTYLIRLSNIVEGTSATLEYNLQ